LFHNLPSFFASESFAQLFKQSLCRALGPAALARRGLQQLDCELYMRAASVAGFRYKALNDLGKLLRQLFLQIFPALLWP
jgi:hypothetical protein